MKSICIIPARGGSKRIPRKNIKDFLGIPIIAYSIKAAIASGIFNEVMVSTDDVEIAEVARKYGASVPFMRSYDTSNDYSTTEDVIDEVLLQYAGRNKSFDYICCIYATAPFITSEKIREAYELLRLNSYDSVFTCVPFSYPIQRGLIIDNHKIKMKWPEYETSRSQDLVKVYHDAGQLYLSKITPYYKNRGFWGENAGPLILSDLEVQDIDTETDWKIAEIKYKLIHGV